ncbi:hypothetical protein [Ornithinibacillus sp. JPR2-1]|uniref:hypothetical protein n=1 Tax=Ornithinibacillus sp. JPR2-1 TaxID=2094019 RepID=UPI0031E2E6BD
MRLEGYVSKKAIRYWLENYESLAAGDKPIDAIPGNSGPKEYDGIRMSQLNKVMLDKAIEDLPDEIKACCKARWIYRVPRNKTLKIIGITRNQYDYNCRQAVDLIHDELNGSMIGVRKLLDKIRS